LIMLSIGAGLFLTIWNRGIQFRKFGHAIQVIRGKYDRPDQAGELSHFQALCTALSATIGLGNIAGVAVAISTGGPGALFWMWLVACVGMATKFTTCTLAIKYRKVAPDGSTHGGPMHYIEQGLGKKWKPLALTFASFGAISAFGGGNMFQSNQTALALSTNFGVPTWVSAIVLGVLVALVIVGGIKRIGHVAGTLVPFMCVVYVLGALFVILTHILELPSVFAFIVKDAFTGDAVAGGAFGTVIHQGVKRAVFSNEAGLGSAPIAHATAKTDEPIREGVVAMIGPFVDTIVVCTMTAMVIIITDAWKSSGVAGATLTTLAFDSAITGFGRYIVTIGIATFAFSTMISWSYYGQQCVEYLFGEWMVLPYKILYVVAVSFGAVWTFTPILNFSDTVFGLMIIPNLIGTFGMVRRVSSMRRDYFERMKIDAEGGER